MHSLRARLVGTLLGIFVAAWAIVGVYACVQFAQARSGSLDHGLDEIGRILLLSMPSEIGRVSSTSNLQLSDGAPSGLERFGKLRFQVWNKSRHEVAVRSAGASGIPLKADFVDGFDTVSYEGEEWRVYAISDARDEVQVQVGKPMSELAAEVKDLLIYALAASFLAVLIVGIALKIVVHWSLRPVVKIQDAITRRQTLDLTPLPDRDLPCEVKPLVESFNRLLGRLEHTLQAERRFLTEAAHELRTPLAVLLTHAQVAQRARSLDEARASLDHLVRGVERSARLSQQLLDSARLDVERQAGEQVPVELADIVAVVTREFEMMAAQRSQSITLDTEPGVIRGNVDELGILIRNLLDNALRYAGQGCRVAVRCMRDVNDMRLEVLDDGPGVPEADRDRIFDRFYRGTSSLERGSGIGLALVSRIAQSHQAEIRTGLGLGGRGFGISVTFRAVEEGTTPLEGASPEDDESKPLGFQPARAPS